jgi:hypothetical protein
VNLKHVLKISRAVTVALVAFSPSVAAAQNSSVLYGVIKSDTSSTPVVGAELLVPSLNLTARTDSLGRYRLTGLSAGTHSLVIRKVGYEPVSSRMTLVSDDTLEFNVKMRPTATTLAESRVTASASPTRLAAFEERRKQGFGTFITSEVFEKNPDLALSSVLPGRLPGIRYDNERGKMVAISTRSRCRVQVILDGVAVYSGNDDARGGRGEEPFDLNTLQTRYILAIEYYSPATTPLQYRGTAAGKHGSACGTLIVWTR